MLLVFCGTQRSIITSTCSFWGWWIQPISSHATPLRLTSIFLFQLRLGFPIDPFRPISCMFLSNTLSRIHVCPFSPIYTVPCPPFLFFILRKMFFVFFFCIYFVLFFSALSFSVYSVCRFLSTLCRVTRTLIYEAKPLPCKSFFHKSSCCSSLQKNLRDYKDRDNASNFHSEIIKYIDNRRLFWLFSVPLRNVAMAVTRR
jgi:hypothetical protein